MSTTASQINSITCRAKPPRSAAPSRIADFFAPPVLAQLALFCLPTILMLLYMTVTLGTGLEMADRLRVMRWHSPTLWLVMKLITKYGLYLFHLFFIRHFWRAWKRRDRKGCSLILIYYALQFLINVLLLGAFKAGIGRARPLQALDGLESRPFSVKSANHSFPSGHTAEAVAAGSIISLYSRRTWMPLLLGLLSAAISFSRLFLQQHYTSDILAGLVFGALVTLCFNYLSKRGFP